MNEPQTPALETPAPGVPLLSPFLGGTTAPKGTVIVAEHARLTRSGAGWIHHPRLYATNGDAAFERIMADMVGHVADRTAGWRAADNFTAIISAVTTTVEAARAAVAANARNIAHPGVVITPPTLPDETGPVRRDHVWVLSTLAQWQYRDQRCVLRFSPAHQRRRRKSDVNPMLIPATISVHLNAPRRVA